MTRTSISSLSRLKPSSTEIRARGLAYDEVESSEDVYCVAAGVHDHTGELVAGLSISVPTTRWDDDRRQALAGSPRRRGTPLRRASGTAPPHALTATATACRSGPGRHPKCLPARNGLRRPLIHPRGAEASARHRPERGSIYRTR